MHNISEGIRYLLVGVATTVLNIFIYNLLIAMSVNYLLSTTFAFVVSVIFAFFANKYYVFMEKSEQLLLKELLLFSSTRISTFLIETLGLVVLITGLSVSEGASKIIMNIIVVIINYIASKYFIFKGEKSEEDGMV